MRKIEHSEILSLVSEGFSATPEIYSTERKAKILDDLASLNVKNLTFSKETKLLINLMEKWCPVVSSAALQKLFKCEIISIPAPIFNAFSKVTEGRPSIVIFDGLLDAALAHICVSSINTCLPKSLEKMFPREKLPSTSAGSLARSILLLLINRFIYHGEPLPDFDLLSSEMKIDTDADNLFMGTLWWVLLHELGHIELGHTKYSTNNSRHSICHELIVAEKISKFQSQEFEADKYVYDSLNELGKKDCFYAWTHIALTASLMLEVRMANKKGTHPLAINRLRYAHDISTSSNVEASNEDTLERLTKHASAHVKMLSGISENKRKGLMEFDDLSRDDLFLLLSGLKDAFFETGINIERFINSTGSSWRTRFE
tara:strand:+ start:1007 stop:2122 length:1116 start_codon:yes stop_codon:yes gene_type:complete